MTRKLALTAASAAAALMMTTSPAMATGKWGCKWTKWCSSTSGGSTTTSGGHTPPGSTSGGSTTTTSGGSTSGGTPVPEPGMLGIMGLGFIGLAAARRRQSRRR